ncbi:MAG: hypothetical protein GXP63_03815 [DPANN group archaeon]|nr:hypothetical protein [DPANN group archaeon]
MLDKEKIESLPLPDRVEALRRIQEERRKELEEAKALQEEAEQQMDRDQATAQVSVPMPEPVDISKLFLPEGDELEARAEVEQVEGEDFFMDYGRAFEGLSEEGFYRTIVTAMQADRIETHINPSHYTLQSKKAVEDSTASVGVIEQIRKYTKG